MIKQKIKVMHIAQSAGGVAEYLEELLKNIDKSKYDNSIIISNDYKDKKEILGQVSKHFFVDMVREINPKKDFKAILKIRKIIKDEKPDIVYLHSSKAGALGRLSLVFKNKVKIIYNAHGWYFNADIGRKKIVYRIIERILALKTNKIIAISRSEYNSAVENKICKKDKIVLIENGINIGKFNTNNDYRKETRKKYNIKDNDVVIGIVGRISEQKDPLTTIKAAHQLIGEDKKYYFMFVGTGDLEKEIRLYSKNNKIEDNIIITGWVNNVEKYIPAFDIALLPSKWEGFGLAIVEYMACKKPIIATQIGGIADILNNPNNAFFINKGDSFGIVEQVKNIIGDKNKIKKVVENNYEEVKKRFSIEREVKDTEKIFENILI